MTQPQQPSGSPARFCSNCGTSLSPQAGFCPQCGTATPQAQPPGGPPPVSTPPPAVPPPQQVPPPVQPPAQQAPRPSAPFAPGTHVPNYLVQAILVTIFCCLPFGIVSIVYAAQVNGKLGAGDFAGALETSRKAKTWAWVSFWVGLGITILWVLIGIVIPLAAV